MSEKWKNIVLKQCTVQLLGHGNGINECSTTAPQDEIFQPIPFMQARVEVILDERIAMDVPKILENEISAKLFDAFEADLLITILDNRRERKAS